MSARWQNRLSAGVLLLALVGTTSWVAAQPASVPQAGGAAGAPPNTTSPPAAPVAVSAPIPAYQTKPAELQVISTEVLDKLLNQQNTSVQWYIGISTAVILLFSIFISILVGRINHTSERNRDEAFKREREGLRDEFERLTENADFERYKQRTQEELNQRFDKLVEETKTKLATEVEGQIKTLFEDRYEEQIARLTKALTQEVLMTTPDARGNLVSILRRTVSKLPSVVTQLPDDEAADDLHQLLAHAIGDWHTLGQLYSPDRGQLETGLLDVHVRPIPEALDQLKRLKQRYPADMDLLPNIVAAIAAVEKKAVEQAVQNERT